jgi:murein DD-endopeptidase MepM/ murein hydrolase activator NlpD
MRLWPVALALALVALCAGTVGQHRTKKPTKPPITSLKNDLGKLRDKKKDIQSKLKATKGKVRKVKGDLQQIDTRLDTVVNALEETTDRLQSGRTRQKRLAGELVVATKNLDQTREQVRRRLRWMYTHEEQTVVSALVQARDISEVASRAYLLKHVAKADRKLFDNYSRLRQETADKKQSQDRLVVEIAGLKHDQESQKQDLDETRQDKAAVLGDLVKQQRDLERLIRQLDSEEASIAARIAAYYAGAGKTSGLRAFTGRFSKPVAGVMTSGFGMRFHPILKRYRMHAGVDFGARTGTPIHAAADGIVILSTYSQGYGNEVVIDHGGGISTLYGHCSRILVSAGQRVTRGQTVALVGSTGLATGPHLHFEVRVNGRPVNPLGRL